MDVVIKSFNRPYYLERCIRSIYKFLSGNFEIYILDDGTPPEYLDKIKKLFPEVNIFLSPLYDVKVQALREHIEGVKDYNQSAIPVEFWIAEISKRSEYFILLEDDIWLTNLISLIELRDTMFANNIVMTKLNWLGNPSLVNGEKSILTSNIEEVKPHIPFLSDGVFMNKYRIRSILFHTGLLKMIRSEFKYQIPYYTLYAVASACFNKEYWLSLWDKEQSVVQEHVQLHKAATWFNNTNSRYAKTEIEVTQTSFITSATNMFGDVGLDIFRFNHYLNVAWLSGKLDCMLGFPKDFNEENFKDILDESKDPLSTYSEWIKWIERFKSQYKKIGCKVD